MANSQIDIRPVSAEEVALLEVHLRYGPLEKHAERLQRQNAGKVLYLIAWLEERPVGHALLKWEGATEAHITSHFEAPCPDVEDLLVDKGVRSQGIGTQLLQKAENVVLARGLSQIGLSVGLDNPRARALYERLGYHDAGCSLHTESGSYVDADGNKQTWEETCVYLVKALR